MFQKILLILLIIVVVGFVAFRLSGAGAEIARREQFFTNPFTILFKNNGAALSGTTTSIATFPYPATPSIPTEFSSIDTTYPASNQTASETNLIDIEQQYDVLKKKVAVAQNFGNPSPYRGLVHIAQSYSGTSANDPALEYITLEASSKNTSLASITGWSLQSMYSNVRVFIPYGTTRYAMGQVPAVSAISLRRGERAIVTTGVSPVGISFKENLCTGYLNQFQTFTPSLNENCPNAENEALSEPATTRTADPACIAYTRTIPTCRFPLHDEPTVTAACNALLRYAMTYNGCISRNSWRPSFEGDMWRIFIGASKKLWRKDHDVIRLLDAQGRTVDVWTY